MNTAARLRREMSLRLPKAPAIGPCTRQSARCPDARDYLTELRPCCRSHLIETMSAVAEVFKEVGCKWWADYGTLLGAVRNPLTTWADYPWLPQEGRPEGPIPPGIIPHDKDCDVGVLAEHWHLIYRAIPKLRRRGFHVVLRTWSRSIKVRYSEKNHTNVDVFTWAPTANGAMARRTYIGIDKYKGREFPRSWVSELSEVEWEGLRIPAPRNPEQFCEFRYGPDWRTPLPANNDGVPR